MITKDFKFTVGETWMFTFTCNDLDDRPLPGLASATIEWLVVDPIAKARVLLVTKSDYVHISDLATGEVTVLIPASVTGPIPIGGSYLHVARVTLVDGTVSFQVQGKLAATENLFLTYPT